MHMHMVPCKCDNKIIFIGSDDDSKWHLYNHATIERKVKNLIAQLIVSTLFYKENHWENLAFPNYLIIKIKWKIEREKEYELGVYVA